MSKISLASVASDTAESETMISIDHVSMVFNIAGEQLNSLKEYVIALAHRELRFKEFYALNDITFKVEKGDVFGILGTNGSGKSTLLKIIAGVLDPTLGTCTVKGSIAPLIELGAGFDLELTARENIFLNGALLGYSKEFVQEHFEEIVDFAEVRDFLDIPMKNYSSGMVARIAFAIATVIIPDILIVDEVLAVGDFMFQQKCERRIQTLIKDHGVTVLIVSHNNDQIERLCNKAVWIEKGELKKIGPAHDVCITYRAIGGRSGSEQEQKEVLSLLALQNDAACTATPIYGEDRFGVASRISELANVPSENIILVNSDSEKSCRIAAQLSGVIDARILSTRSDHIPDSMLREIQSCNPKRLVVIGNHEQIEEQVLDKIKPYAPAATISRIENGIRTPGIEAYEFGQATNGWGSTAILAQDGSDYALLTLSPYAISQKCALFYWDSGNDLVELGNIVDTFEHIIILKRDNCPIESTKDFQQRAATIFNNCADADKANDEVNNWLLINKDFGFSDSAIIVMPDNIVDNRLIGPLASKKSAPILFCTPRLLGSTLHAAHFLKSQKAQFRHLYFLGTDARFNSTDRKILQNAASCFDA